VPFRTRASAASKQEKRGRCDSKLLSMEVKDVLSVNSILALFILIKLFERIL